MLYRTDSCQCHVEVCKCSTRATGIYIYRFCYSQLHNCVSLGNECLLGLVSAGSRDGSISLWCVQDPARATEDNDLHLCVKSPAKRLCSTLDPEKGKEKIRDLVYERNSQVTLLSGGDEIFGSVIC